MKKNVWILAVVACWMFSALQVKADVIWEPYHDDFYQENMASCEYLNRTYTAAGPDGKVIVYESPENPTVVTTWENGFKAYISFTYTDADGNVWGVYDDSQSGINGWVPMAYMTVVYDYISFQEEFADSITEENGTIPAVCAGQTVYFWKYPGAENYYEMPMPEDAESLPQYSKLFIDEAGLQWGYIGYFRGTKHCWVCLANPNGSLEELYPQGVPERGGQNVADSTSSEEEGIVPKEDAAQEGDKNDTSASDIQSITDVSSDTERIEPEKDNGLIGLVIGLVVAVTGVTGGALVWLKKKK